MVAIDGLEGLLDLARVNRQQRDEFRDTPELAVTIIQRALDTPGIRNVAAYALGALRAERSAPRVTTLGAAPVGVFRESRVELARLDLSCLELAWSTGAGDRMLGALAEQLDRQGGLASLRPT